MNTDPSVRQDYDVVVAGATTAGIAAAISAARLGMRVALIERQRHVGGMATSGLGKSDIETRDAIGGLFADFVQRVLQYYTLQYGEDSEQVAKCHDGYYYEPSVAESVFLEMLAEQPNIELYLEHELSGGHLEEEELLGLDAVDRTTGQTRSLHAATFIDATYEGDLLALAGCEFRQGREGRADFGEPHAGVIYLNHETHEVLAGSTGEADDRLPAYTYRLCLTDNPDNAAVLHDPPPGYNRADYLGYLDDLTAGRLSGPRNPPPGRGFYAPHFNTLLRVFSFTELPNRKFDVNINPRPLGFPFAEENAGYIEADWAEREAIAARHRSLALGLLYFIQNDDAVPADQREMANIYHLPLDEFVDNGHFPRQLYIREARRLVGEYTLTEHDVAATGRYEAPPVHADAIAVGEFPIDSFPTSKREPEHERVLEGYLSMIDSSTRPYQIPYRIMLPKSIDRLLVPVAASTTHVAFSTIRMEPCWMAMGEAAGVAAGLAVKLKTTPRRVPNGTLQEALRVVGQVTSLSCLT